MIFFYVEIAVVIEQGEVGSALKIIGVRTVKINAKRFALCA
jgi:hypothetical protein